MFYLCVFLWYNWDINRKAGWFFLDKIFHNIFKVVSVVIVVVWVLFTIATCVWLINGVPVEWVMFFCLQGAYLCLFLLWHRIGKAYKSLDG